MKLRILFPGRKVDAVTYRCEGVWSRGHTVGAARVLSLMLWARANSVGRKEFIGHVF